MLNEHELGNDRKLSILLQDKERSTDTRQASWMDHPRDLFLMVNHFRKHMKRPMVGIAHSMGGNNLINLSLMHPRLFTSLVLIDPVIQKGPANSGNYNPAVASTNRRDRWPSREAAKAAFKRSKFYQTWDSRVLEKWIEHGLRDLPTGLYPDIQAKPSTLPAISADPSTASIVPDKNLETEVTLKTTKHQEVLSFLRANFPTNQYPDPDSLPNPDTHPDVPLAVGPNSPFYRPEPITTFTRLPHVRPSVLYVFGDKSDMSRPDFVAEKLAATGVGVGGSGGVKQGRVAEVTFKGIGHLIPMEVTSQTADAAANWIVPEIERFRRTEEAHRAQWSKVPKAQRNQMSEKYREVMLGDWVKRHEAATKTKL